MRKFFVISASLLLCCTLAMVGCKKAAEDVQSARPTPLTPPPTPPIRRWKKSKTLSTPLRPNEFRLIFGHTKNRSFRFREDRFFSVLTRGRF